jgi:UDP-glucose 4-epimerase
MTEGNGRDKRVLITGVSSFLGLRLAKRLEHDASVSSVIGVDVDEPPLSVSKLDFIRADIRSPLIARVLDSTKPDTLIHTNISSQRARLGGRAQMKENNVIGTMQLLAAAQRSEHVKKVIMKSSTAVYGSSPGEPSIIPEDHASRHVDLSGYGKDCAEAETYARDYGRRRPDVDLVILRTQNVVGPTVRTNITDYLSLPVTPTALGYDPRLQFLHEEDAVEAFGLAMRDHARGIYNVAADGIVYLSKATRLMGRMQLPLILPAAQQTADLLRRFGWVDFPTDQLKLILFGRVVSTRRIKEALGFSPKYTTEQSLIDFRDTHDGKRIEEPRGRPPWERDLIEHIRRRTEKESV